MRKTECFLIEPTDRYWKSLRRYAFKGARPGCEYHNAEVIIEEIESTVRLADYAPAAERSDPRWPLKCDRCDYIFEDEDHWQVEYDRQYLAPDGQRYSRGGEHDMTKAPRAPVGAMWRATWLEDICTGPDGHCYIVRTPGGDWIIDYKRNEGDSGWTRSGVAPRLTVRPSILIGSREDGAWEYHGFLTDGCLEEC